MMNSRGLMQLKTSYVGLRS